MLKKPGRHTLVVLLVILCAGIAVLWWQHAAPPRVIEKPPLAASAVPAEPAVEGEVHLPLNIQLPQEHLLVDPALVIPEPTSPLKPLFKIEEKPSTVAVGGGLILEEDPKKPEAPIWDQVKGAKVEVEVKID